MNIASALSKLQPHCHNRTEGWQSARERKTRQHLDGKMLEEIVWL